MTKFRTQFDSKYKGSKGELNTQNSLTVPDQTLSVKQLLANHTRGIIAPNGGRIYEAMYFDTEIPHFDDIVDAHEFKQAMSDAIKDIESKAQDELEQIKAKKLEQLAKQKENQTSVSNEVSQEKGTDVPKSD